MNTTVVMPQLVARVASLPKAQIDINSVTDATKNCELNFWEIFTNADSLKMNWRLLRHICGFGLTCHSHMLEVHKIDRW